ncbi:Ubiquitin-conjugating enzyme E2 S-C [Acrodontium crateriforme]|uniref:Ubiquitin-conjugating enzyme E2 2 n=1 Tax=Acrodontium crateriforme TaxID=150365 RepID=A0AAQ3R8Y1_9PEZI|nr:Ubiquitin-conjugating enzyme E2 S-C [Acrodontium crateriforme]
MNARALRRLAADHGALHTQPLPPNYLFAPTDSDDDLTELNILLAGPTHTPFAAGVFKLHLAIPPEYPAAPPTAHFRTPIFHPNVDPQTGGVCVETLKRDWDSSLTLRDILVVIGCLLIQPNPDSALNAEAGGLIQEDYASYGRRAELMTSIHAAVPSSLKSAVREAQERGQEKTLENDHAVDPAMAPPRRRRPTARQRGTTAMRRTEGSPSGARGKRKQVATESHEPFVFQAGTDDVFRNVTPPPRNLYQEDEDMTDANQENDGSRSPEKLRSPTKRATPRRPRGPPIPLGELTLDEADSSSNMSDDDEEPEYPPSPRKSPRKSPVRRRPDASTDERGESSRMGAASRVPPMDLTPPNQAVRPLAMDSPYVMTVDETPSPRKARTAAPRRPTTPTSTRRGNIVQPNPFNTASPLETGRVLFAFKTPRPKSPSVTNEGGISKPQSPSSAEKKRAEERRRRDLDAKLWDLCGGDIKRWNRGDFDGEPFANKASRW